jgi:hypothetical protein
VRLVLRQMRDVSARVIGGILNGMNPKATGDRDYYYYYGRGNYYATEEPKDPPAAPPTANEGAAE